MRHTSGSQTCSVTVSISLTVPWIHNLGLQKGMSSDRFRAMDSFHDWSEDSLGNHTRSRFGCMLHI